MDGDLLFQYLIWMLFMSIFIACLVEAVRFPTRTNVDIALLFASPAAIILIGVAAAFGLIRPGPIANAVNTSLLLAIPFLFLRLVDDFSHVPAPLRRLGEVGFVTLSVGAFVFYPPRPVLYDLLTGFFFVGLQVFATFAFAREARRTKGVTSRRMAAVAWGSIMLGLAIAVTMLRAWLKLDFLGTSLFNALSLASGVAYFMGFAPPLGLRRSWQQPEIRAFLERGAALRRTPDLASVVREIEKSVAAAMGASSAAVALWDQTTNMLQFPANDEEMALPVDQQSISGRVFLTRRAQLATHYGERRNQAGVRDSVYGRHDGDTVLSAPLVAGDKPLGVLNVAARHASIFARDDLRLLGILADQVAAILEDRHMIGEITRIRAREEAMRLRDEFLSAAAHDLRNPLAVIMGNAQLLARRAERNPEAPADRDGLRLLEDQARRMARLVNQLLDASRVEQGRILGTRETVDLIPLARDVCTREYSDRHEVRLKAAGPVMGSYDRFRIEQLLDNLILNAVKYSPDGGEVTVEVRCEGNEAHIAVTDRGVGIEEAELPHLFDRFRRGANAESRNVTGTGLGLFICRGIVEEHGGRIWATSSPGEGSTFHVALPAEPAAERTTSAA